MLRQALHPAWQSTGAADQSRTMSAMPADEAPQRSSNGVPPPRAIWARTGCPAHAGAHRWSGARGPSLRRSCPAGWRRKESPRPGWHPGPARGGQAGQEGGCSWVRQVQLACLLVWVQTWVQGPWSVTELAGAAGQARAGQGVRGPHLEERSDALPAGDACHRHQEVAVRGAQGHAGAGSLHWVHSHAGGHACV